ncbi:MAG: hypothetical protein HY744_21690 [Deltaproteobacteria bacterium]|nr:hypothetical protein [Deltaproteobacteria bacterium]
MSDPSLTKRQRREVLRAVGEQLRPGSGAERENVYRSALLGVDLGLPLADEAPAAEFARDGSRPESRLVDERAAAQVAFALKADRRCAALRLDRSVADAVARGLVSAQLARDAWRG